MKKGIDVSNHNGKVDWKAAKNAGLDFAMLRCGYGSDISSQDDSQFARNVSECEKYGIPWGAYLYSYALTADNAKSELSHALRLLKGKRPTYPVFIDMEDADGYKRKHGGIPSKATNTAIIQTFCDGIKAAGFKAGYYVNRDWYYNYIEPAKLTGYAFWYARPGVSKPDLTCDIWQDNFDSTGGSWPGANLSSGGCDTDVAYTVYGETEKDTEPGPAPSGSAFTSDTTGKLNLTKGGRYQLKVTCAAGRPSVVAGSGGVVVITYTAREGNAYLYRITGLGDVGSATGIYINGGKVSTFVVAIESACKSDTTMDMQLKVGTCYMIGLPAPVKPTVTCGTGGIACVAGVFQDGDGKWLAPIVACGKGKTGVYTQISGESAVKRFVLEGT